MIAGPLPGEAPPEADPAPPVLAPPAAFVALDHGTATLAAALVGPIDGRRRLLAAVAVPAAGGTGSGQLGGLLAARVRAADAGLAAKAALPADGAALPELAAVGRPSPLAVVLAATEATRAVLEADASVAGWRTVGASAETDDVLAATRLATRPEVELVILGTSDPATADERELVGELVALVAAVAARRPGLPVVLVGAAAGRVADIPLATETVAVPRLRGDPERELRAILSARRAGAADARRALAAVTGTLAEVLDLRVEMLEVGVAGAIRARATPAADAGAAADVVAAEVPGAALGLADDDAILDRIEAWVTIAIDRARLRDRLAEIRLDPWSELDGEGALLRAAALRASVETLVDATDAELGGPAPDLVVLAGGAWSAIPAPAAMLALADAVRRPGIVQVALDAARVLAPLGTIGDVDARRELVRDLLPDVLVRLGTLVLVGGGRLGRVAGQLTLHTGPDPITVPLASGSLALVDLPPGQAGSAELAFRSAVDLGTRGRRFAVPVTGGLAGLVVDLREVPLRLPERGEDRRDALVRWERVLWPERDR